MTHRKYHSAIPLLLLCLTGCQSHGPAATATNSIKLDDTKSITGPSEDDIEKDFVKGLPPYISEHCRGNKQVLLDSLPSIKYKIRANQLINDFKTEQIVRIYGTFYWPLRDKALGIDPSAGSRLVLDMTNKDAADPDRTIKWDFLAFGPYSEILSFTQEKHVGVTCTGY